jgi:predicted DNA binding CopG/RHH family protein
MKKKVPRLKTDREAEAFLAQDLSNLDFSQFKPTRSEVEKKDQQINLRVPKPLLAAVKARAKARGIPIRTSFGKRSNGQWPHRSNNRLSRKTPLLPAK